MAMEQPMLEQMPKLTYVRFSKNSPSLVVDNHAKKQAFGCLSCSAVVFDILGHTAFHNKIEGKSYQPMVENELIDRETNKEEIMSLA